MEIKEAREYHEALRSLFEGKVDWMFSCKDRGHAVAFIGVMLPGVSHIRIYGDVPTIGMVLPLLHSHFEEEGKKIDIVIKGKDPSIILNTVSLLEFKNPPSLWSDSESLSQSIHNLFEKDLDFVIGDSRSYWMKTEDPGLGIRAIANFNDREKRFFDFNKRRTAVISKAFDKNIRFCRKIL